MTAATTNAGQVRSHAARLRDATWFEWTKLSSVRSTWMSMVIALIVAIGGSWLIAASAKASGDNGLDTALPAPFIAFQALTIAQILMIVVATLSMTSEYSSGSIMTSLQSVPVRGFLLSAKMIMLVVVGLVFGAVLTVLGVLIAVPAAGEYGSYTGAELVNAILGAGAYVALLNVLTVGLGTALRSSAGTITTILAVLLILPQVLPVFGIDWLANVADCLPSNAATALVTHSGDPYGWGVGLALMAGWAAAGAIAGYAVLRTRDA